MFSLITNGATPSYHCFVSGSSLPYNYSTNTDFGFIFKTCAFRARAKEPMTALLPEYVFPMHITPFLTSMLHCNCWHFSTKPASGTSPPYLQASSKLRSLCANSFTPGNKSLAIAINNSQSIFVNLGLFIFRRDVKQIYSSEPSKWLLAVLRTALRARMPKS